MASSHLRPKPHHARSVSFPSTSHPLIPQFSDHLCRLRASSEATSSSLPSISNRLSGLEDLYDCVDDLLLLPHTQQTFSQEGHTKWAHEALDGFLRLLDACAATKDIFSKTKEDVKEQLSDVNASNFDRYLASRKKAKKAMQKLLKDFISVENKDRHFVPTVSTLREVEVITLEVLESLLCYAAGTKVQSRRGGWSLVSKLMHPKSNSGCQAKETNMSKFETVDAALHSLTVTGHKPSKFDDNKNIETLQNQLGKQVVMVDEDEIPCLLHPCYIY
ncbi:hypothetical protein HYC85_017290 [Camellia sinensis]|uniref:Uncharacterized protein n=1 Tax=Camellia sinensis TaxID=4442 RepID=A0A7J7H273_CAMSI|nr:hypothetical protein HYC85_017290 [Camellia sinensis]